MNWLAALFSARRPTPALVSRSARPAPVAGKPAGGSRSRLVAGSAVLALAVGTVATYEGLRTQAYIPIPGDVPTICFGETKGVKLGDTKTVAECKAMLGTRLVEFETAMRACLVAPDAIPDRSYVAFLSLSYNIGAGRPGQKGGFCSSTVARRANAGDLKGACNAIPAFNKAGGRVVPGLVRRRAEEQAICLSGLQE